MGLHYELPVFKDVYRLILKLFEYTKEFPREYKYTLGQDLKRDSLQLVRCIYRANRTYEKRSHLEDFLDIFELIKFEIRLCHDFKIISTKNYAELSGLLDSIGKQVVAWKKSQPASYQP